MMIRKIKFYQDHFLRFFQKLDSRGQEKVEYVFYIIINSTLIPTKFFKHIEGTDGLYEIRIQVSNNNYRIFCFFDKGQLVVILHGINKKSRKTPKREITKAEKLRQQYYNTKGE